MGRRWKPRRLGQSGVGLAVGAGAAAVQLAPLCGSGYLLVRDMVFVPHLPMTGALLGRDGVPRAVPSDLVVALASHVVPGWAVQRIVLVGIFIVAGWGAARMVPGTSRAGAAAAAVVYTWNPYVTERLLLGQWALLVGYAVLPHVAVAMTRALRDDSTDARRSAVGWICVAGLGGASAELLAVLVAVPLAFVAWRRRRRALTLVTAGAFAAIALPWLLPALLQPGGTPHDHVGATAFAARPDTPLGTLGSVLSLGGVWDGEAVPTGRDQFTVGIAALVLSAIAVVAVVRARRTLPSGPLLVSAALGLALAMWGAVPGLRHGLGWLVATAPGGGLFRDGQKLVAPLAVVISLGLGMTVAELVARRRLVQAGLLAVVPIAVLPGTAYGADNALTPADWPAMWAQTAHDVDHLGPGPVAVLPWSTYRAYSWNHDRVVLDPSDRWFARRVVRDDALQVDKLATPVEDPLARDIAAAATGTGPLTDELARRGYAGAVVDTTTPAGQADARRLASAHLVARHGSLAVYAVSATNHPKVPRAPLAPLIVVDVVAVLVAATSIRLRRVRETAANG
ncbi:MAG: hypothetical protein ACJ735_04680 [Actinomycetes bacterium]